MSDAEPIRTVGDLLAALSALDPALPVGAPFSRGAAGVVPLAVEAVELRAPHPGWSEEAGLWAVGFELGSDAALYHERRGGGLVTAVLVAT